MKLFGENGAELEFRKKGPRIRNPASEREDQLQKKLGFSGHLYVDASKRGRTIPRSRLPVTSASCSELTEDFGGHFSTWSGCRVIDCDILFSAIESFCHYECGGSGKMSEVPRADLGRSSKFAVKPARRQKTSAVPQRSTTTLERAI